MPRCVDESVTQPHGSMMTTKQFWLAGITAAVVSPILPGAVIGYFAFATLRWINFAVENDREEDRLNALKQKGVDSCA